MPNRTKRTIAIAVIASVGVLAIPPLVAEALYMAAVPGAVRDLRRPQPPLTPGLSLPAFWLEAGEKWPAEVEPIRPWKLAWPFLLSRGVVLGNRRPGSHMAQLAARSLPVLDRRTTAARWHASFWATSVWLSSHWNAAELTQAYVDGAGFGRGAAGLDAAAKAYFATPANELAVHQFALVVALTRSPTGLNPDCHPERALQARNRVLHRLAEIDLLSRAEYQAATAHGLDILPRACER